MSRVDLSVIIPLYNEEESIRPLYEAVSAAVSPLDLDVEILFVDDGSADRTFALARQLAISDSRVRVIKFRRNYGQTPAMAAGIDHARGTILVTMDGDLQNDPADIPLLLERIDAGFDIVVGWRHKRQDKFFTRILPSKIANWLIGKITGVPIKDNGCSLKAYRASLIKGIPLYSEMHRFIPAMASLAGARVSEIRVRHHARRFGESKYGLSRIYKVLFDLITIRTILSFSARPLLWFVRVAGIAGFAALCALGGYFWTLQDAALSGVVFMGLSVLFGSLMIFLLLLGLLGVLIYRVSGLRAEMFSRLSATVVGSQGQPEVET